MTERMFPAGTVIIEKGKPGARVLHHRERLGHRLGGGEPGPGRSSAGDHFGEIALIDDGPRMAEVTAETDLECFALASWQFRPFVQDHPDVAWALMQSLVKRIVRDAGAEDEV